jgi:Na+-translocating ferredoxin:NAD+ oxidoreductase RnfA subunit
MTTYPFRVGVATDCWLNAVVWAGNLNETVSHHTAVDCLAGKRVGCIVCVLLGALVERHHCAKVLDPNAQEAAGAAIRAALIMIAFFVAVYWLVRTLA